MLQLGDKKHKFLLCLGISIFFSLVIYMRTDTKGLQRKPITPDNFKPLSPNEVKAFSTDPPREKELPERNATELLKGSYSCHEITRNLHFITNPLSRDEEDYPIAFIVTIHKELELFVRVLRAIYMPQNVYCIHVDAKAPAEYFIAVWRLTTCFQNIFIATRSETVTYAGFSRLQADINCLEDLAKSEIAWKKVVNLCGQEFPTMSNLELVQYMQSKKWRDRNMTPGIKQPASMKHRTELHHSEIRGSLTATTLKKHSPPQNITIYFGTAYYALTRDFVNFVLLSTIAQNLLEWSKDTFSPDEHFWVTLNHIKDAPGSNLNGEWSGNIRAIKWRDQEGKAHDGCKGRYVRDICIYGLDDLPWIINKKSMFANKFESNTFPEALYCLEQWHRNKVLSQATIPINPSWLLPTKNISRSFNCSYVA